MSGVIRRLGVSAVVAALGLLLSAGCAAGPGSAPRASSAGGDSTATVTSARAPSNATSSSVTPPEPARLLAKYNLHPTGAAPLVTRDVLNLDAQSHSGMVDASKAIGLDLSKYDGRTVVLTSYALAERTQAGTVVTACLVTANDEVVGAWLVLPGYYGGVSSLADRHAFAPVGLTPRHFRFEGVSSVSLAGGELRAGDSMSKLVTLLEASTPQKGAVLVAPSRTVSVYVNYTDGPRVAVRLTTPRRRGRTYVTLESAAFRGWHMVADPALKPYVDELTRGM